MPHKLINNQIKPRVEESIENIFRKFLAKGRTFTEIETKFGYSKEEADSEIKKVLGEDELFITRNAFQEEVVVILPKLAEVKLQPRVWTYHWQPDGEPYLWVKMPKSIKEKMKIVPLADAHFGAFAHDREKFLEYVEWIASEPHVFAFINGDLFENAHGDSNKGVSMYDQEIRPRTQVEEMTLILSKIAHKILWAIPGNHEDRSRTRDYDPLEYLCTKLGGIPYSYEPIYVDILWGGYVFDFFCQHGNTNSQTKGGKLNAASRPQKYQEFVMFTVMAHVHDSMVNKTQRICRDRVNFKLQIKKQYVVICPSFHGYFGTYASKAGYEPGSLGAVACDLYANGDYHASS
jgi:hypothetical protein